MKAYILLFLLICTPLKAQINFIQSTDNQVDYFKSYPNDLKDENGNGIFNLNDFDSLIFIGDTYSNNFGRNVSYAGDVNGDGYSDIVVGCKINSYPNDRWRIYIYYGGLIFNNLADITITSNLNIEILSVSSAGDVNGDGYSDIVISTQSSVWLDYDAYIYFGGLSMDTLADFSSHLGYITGSPRQFSVSTVGDVNGDGYSDIIIGAGSYSHQLWDYWGGATIFYGGTNMDNIGDVNFGELGYGYNGRISVSSAGDVNGDGFSDVIIGFSSFWGSGVNVNIFYGGTYMNNIPDVTFIDVEDILVSTTGDVNGDGFSDIIVGEPSYSSSTGRASIYFGGSSMNNIVDLILTGQSLNNKFGKSVSTAGDVNGDGFSDIIVGAYGFNTGTGRAYIYYGGSSMNNVADVTWTGEAINNYFGNSVSTSGDVNGDGSSDIIVGAYGYNSNIGRAYVFMRKPFIRIKLKVLMEGMYSSLYNQLARKDSVTLLLRDVTSPFAIRDSAKFVIDSLTFLNNLLSLMLRQEIII